MPCDSMQHSSWVQGFVVVPLALAHRQSRPCKKRESNESWQYDWKSEADIKIHCRSAATRGQFLQTHRGEFLEADAERLAQQSRCEDGFSVP